VKKDDLLREIPQLRGTRLNILKDRGGPNAEKRKKKSIKVVNWRDDAISNTPWGKKAQESGGSEVRRAATRRQNRMTSWRDCGKKWFGRVRVPPNRG